MKHSEPKSLINSTVKTQRVAIWTRIALCALLAATTGVVRADIVFTNFGAGFAYNTGAGNTLGNDFIGDNLAAAVEFTPVASRDLSSIDIALSCGTSCVDNLTVSLAANTGGKPGAAIESFTFNASTLGPLGTNNPPLILPSVLTPLLAAGTPYWVEVTANSNDSLVWNWNSTGDTSTTADSADGGATWNAPSFETPGALQVNGTPAGATVPEPGAIVLLGTVLLFLAFTNRRRVALLRNQ